MTWRRTPLSTNNAANNSANGTANAEEMARVKGNGKIQGFPPKNQLQRNPPIPLNLKGLWM
jgi:hypothetical protein